MSYKEFTESIRDGVEKQSEPPMLGDMALNEGKKKRADNPIKVKFLIAYLDDPTDLELAQNIFTKSIHCENMLKEVGDVCVFKEESNFDKEGRYTLVLKYAEYCVLDKEATTNGHTFEA